MCTWSVNLFCVFRLENIIYVVWIHWWDNEGIGKMFSHFQCFSLHHGRIEREKNGPTDDNKTQRHTPFRPNLARKRRKKAKYYICNMFRLLSNRWCLMWTALPSAKNHFTHTRTWSVTRAHKQMLEETTTQGGYGKPLHSIGNIG